MKTEKWIGKKVIENGVVFLVKHENEDKEYRIIGNVNIDYEASPIKDALKELVLAHESEMKNGMMMFVADKLEDGKYYPLWRASYEEWMIEDEEEDSEHPFYYDISENEEGAFFSRIVNGEDFTFWLIKSSFH